MKMNRAELATHWQFQFKAPTSRGAQVDLLCRVLAWKLQSNNLDRDFAEKFVRAVRRWSRSAATVNLWHKHGADPTVWAVSSGEIGNWVFSVAFEFFSAYGKCIDVLNADPEFQKWQLESTKSGLSTWVRSNLARKVDIA